MRFIAVIYANLIYLIHIDSACRANLLAHSAKTAKLHIVFELADNFFIIFLFMRDGEAGNGTYLNALITDNAFLRMQIYQSSEAIGHRLFLGRILQCDGGYKAIFQCNDQPFYKAPCADNEVFRKFYYFNNNHPVIARLTKAIGVNTFHANAINWSTLARGNVHLTHIQINMHRYVLDRNHTTGGKNGPCQPPKNRVVEMAAMMKRLVYSPMKNIANFIPEYSV